MFLGFLKGLNVLNDVCLSLKDLNGLCQTILNVVQGCGGTSDFGCDFLKLVGALLKETIGSLTIFRLL